MSIAKTFPMLETERLLLRQVTLDDAEEYHRHFCEDEVDDQLAEYTSWEPVRSLEEARNEIQEYSLKLFDEGRGYRWAMIDKSRGKLVGTCGFYNWDKERGRRAEIGYDLDRACWGKGMMKEALEAIIQFGFDEMGLNRIEALVDPRNSRSKALLSSLYFKEEGVLREHTYFRGRYWDDVSYSLLKHEWPGTRNRSSQE